MKLANLPKAVKVASKRLGRGLGSGKGKTGGRGQKGQKARGKVAVGFTGGGLPLYKKFPLLRGWGNSSIKPNKVVLNLSRLTNLEGVVDVESLINAGLISSSDAKAGVKILGAGTLKSKLTVKGLEVSKSAKAAIEAAGGEVV